VSRRQRAYSNVLRAAEKHRQAVDAKAPASRGWHAILESEAELLVGIGLLFALVLLLLLLKRALLRSSQCELVQERAKGERDACHVLEFGERTACAGARAR